MRFAIESKVAWVEAFASLGSLSDSVNLRIAQAIQTVSAPVLAALSSFSSLA